MFLFTKNQTYKGSYLFKTVGVTNSFNHRERKRMGKAYFSCTQPTTLLINEYGGRLYTSQYVYVLTYILSKLYLFVSFLYGLKP